MGTPTLNQVFPEDYLVPRYGVYASLVSFDQVVTYGVTNIGVKPTVGAEEKPLSETWMPDYDGEALYGKMVKTELLEIYSSGKKVRRPGGIAGDDPKKWGTSAGNC